jgi:hypothetical protein
VKWYEGFVLSQWELMPIVVVLRQYLQIFRYNKRNLCELFLFPQSIGAYSYHLLIRTKMKNIRFAYPSWKIKRHCFKKSKMKWRRRKSRSKGVLLKVSSLVSVLGWQYTWGSKNWTRFKNSVIFSPSVWMLNALRESKILRSKDLGSWINPCLM